MRFLGSLFLMLAMAATAMSQSCDYVTHNSSDSDLSAYTFATQSIGAAAGDRYVVICSEGRMAGTPTLTSVTVAGVTSTNVVTRENSGNLVALNIAAVPTGTTGDVVVTYGAGMVRCGIQIYRLTGLSSPTATDSDSGVHATAPTLTLTAPDGCVIGAAMTSASTSTEVWTGLTKDIRTPMESNTMGTSAHAATSAGSLPITCTFNTGTTGTLVAAGWSYGTAGSAVPIIVQQLNRTK